MSTTRANKRREPGTGSSQLFASVSLISALSHSSTGRNGHTMTVYSLIASICLVTLLVSSNSQCQTPKSAASASTSTSEPTTTTTTTPAPVNKREASADTKHEDADKSPKLVTINHQNVAAAAANRPTSGGHLKFEHQRYDGWYSNLANPEWGTPNSRLRRKVAPAYSDGVYQMSEQGRPSARLLSQKMMRGEDGLASRRNLTTIFVFFGQVISSEILMASESGCPIEMHRIKIDKCDPMYDRDCRGGRTMPFYRAAYDPHTGQSPNLPREQINRVTSWIDGSFIYSTSEAWLNTMRSFDGRGTLKMVASPNSPHGQESALDAASAAAAAMLAGGEEMPMSLFGYPMRNKKRAPLINQMPAHHLKVKNAERMFLLGDPRTNQNPMILAFGILFYRWHNVLAERIHAQHQNWTDEEIFQRARRLVIASLQNIFLYEYLPTLLDTPSPYSPLKSTVFEPSPGASSSSSSSNNSSNIGLRPDLRGSSFQLPPPGGATRSGSQNLQAARGGFIADFEYDQDDLIRPYSGYKPDLHPGISHVFQSAAFRFGHTMIPPGLYLRDDKCHFQNTPAGYKGIRLCSTWWNAEEVVSKVGIERLLMGAASQIAEREDYVLCNDVRDKLFGSLDFSRRDLAALNIMRGRDNGLADYNTVRQAFKLPKITRWRDINPDLYARQPVLFEELAQLYDDQLDRVDLYIGGMLESDVERGRPGPLFRRIIKEQFERLRDADRFWFENVESGIFSELEIEEIKRISLYDIIVNATLIPEQAIQRDIFKFRQEDPCPQPGQLSSSQLQPCFIVKGHSYFKGNEITYALVCLTLVLIPAVCALVAYAVVRYQDRKRRQFKAKQEYQRNLQASSKSSGSSNSSSPANSNSSSPLASPSPASKSEKFYAKEWLHSNLKRKIKVRFGSSPDETLYILDRKGQVQRQLNLFGSSSIVVELSTTEQYGGGVLSPSSSSAAQLHPLRSASGSVSTLSASSITSLVGKNPATSSKLSQHPVGVSANDLTANDLDQAADHKPLVLIRAARNYDLVLQFYDVQQRRKFVFKLHAYLRSVNKEMFVSKVARHTLLANAETKERRQQRLEQFFREAYALTFGIGSPSASAAGSGGSQLQQHVSSEVGLVMRTSLSRQEFAEALGMKSDSLFVRQMFNCIDKDGNGRISFQEFLDTVVMFSRGKPDDKLRIIFDMCDQDGKGVIERVELVRILRSLVDIAKSKSLAEEEIMRAIHGMFQEAGLEKKQSLDYEQFKLLLGTKSQVDAFGAPTVQEKLTGSESPPSSSSPSARGRGGGFSTFNDATLGQQVGLDMKGVKRNFLLEPSHHRANRGLRMQEIATISSGGAILKQQQPQPGKQRQRGAEMGKGLMKSLSHKWKAWITELEEHRQDIVYLLLFYVIVVVLFFERFIQYGYLSEHMDLRHVMGVGIAITRGSAASLSFCYAMLLVSMCRNLMTWIRTVGVHEYIPLDSHVKFHKVVAMTALLMTVLHTVGHCVNFFHVTQQPVEHLRCLTKEMQFSGESRPTFFYWIFQTITGSTGLLLWSLCSILYVFAHRRVRQRAYSFFWSTHKLYYLIYALTLLHGSSKLTGSPRFWIFFMVPAILFTIDKIISLQTKLLQLEIFETECLPSDVIALKFARPPSFKFLSGQWIRVACTAFRPHEFHAFTLTSAPQDDYLSIHVRAQGPWTWKLRSLFDPANLQYNKLLSSQLPPRIRIEGPFGGGNQDWYKYEVAVMIGGGIGVTPYASILNDLVFGPSSNRYTGVANKKVYFIWICPSHRSFEWFIDVLKEVESRDVTNVLEMHIFITQFFHKFDLRTTMLVSTVPLSPNSHFRSSFPFNTG